ncbi:MAG: ABC transporter permease [Treponema sp.]|jgi:ribose transport system permease protein|nr:ABC transporter permease [Treponema sp.]
MKNTSVIASLLRRPAIVLLVLLFIFFGILAQPYFLNTLNIHNLLRQTSFDVPLALALMIVLIVGGIDLSVGSVLSMASALTISFQSRGVYTGVLVALLFGAAVGAVNGLLVTKGGVVPFIATLGTMTLIKGIMLFYTKQQSIPGTNEAFTFWGNGSLGFFPVPFIAVLILAVLIYCFLKFTRAGRNFYSVGGNSDCAYLAGIHVDKTKLAAFIMSGILASFSGVLLASRLNSSTVQIGQDSNLWAIAAAIIGGASMTGGKGQVLTTFIAVISLGILTNGMNLMRVLTYYQIGIRALVLITIVVLDAVFISNEGRRKKGTL